MKSDYEAVQGSAYKNRKNNFKHNTNLGTERRVSICTLDKKEILPLTHEIGICLSVN